MTDKCLKQSGVKLARLGNYFKFRNKHLLIGWRKYDSELLKRNVPKINKSKIHIFICNLQDFETNESIQSLVDCIQWLTENTKATIRVHVHHKHIDLIEEIKDIFSDINKYLQIEKNDTLNYRISEEGTTLAPTVVDDNIAWETIDTPRYVLKLKYEFDSNRLWATIDCYYTSTLKLYNGAVENEVVKKEPDKNKARIIAKFKSITPFKILKTFKDDEDIWNFLSTSKKSQEKSYIIKPAQSVGNISLDNDSQPNNFDDIL